MGYNSSGAVVGNVCNEKNLKEGGGGRGYLTKYSHQLNFGHAMLAIVR